MINELQLAIFSRLPNQEAVYPNKFCLALVTTYPEFLLETWQIMRNNQEFKETYDIFFESTKFCLVICFVI
jgi:hypothetical protein